MPRPAQSGFPASGFPAPSRRATRAADRTATAIPRSDRRSRPRAAEARSRRAPPRGGARPRNRPAAGWRPPPAHPPPRAGGAKSRPARPRLRSPGSDRCRGRARVRRADPGRPRRRCPNAACREPASGQSTAKIAAAVISANTNHSVMTPNIFGLSSTFAWRVQRPQQAASRPAMQPRDLVELPYGRAPSQRRMPKKSASPPRHGEAAHKFRVTTGCDKKWPAGAASRRRRRPTPGPRLPPRASRARENQKTGPWQMPGAPESVCESIARRRNRAAQRRSERSRNS